MQTQHWHRWRLCEAAFTVNAVSFAAVCVQMNNAELHFETSKLQLLQFGKQNIPNHHIDFFPPRLIVQP